MSNVIRLHPPKRWVITATYRTDSGNQDAIYDVEELSEIHELIEAGPDWNCLVEIKVVLNPERVTNPGITFEHSRELWT